MGKNKNKNKDKITKIDVLSYIEKIRQYISGLNYSQISQTEIYNFYKDIDKIKTKIYFIQD